MAKRATSSTKKSVKKKAAPAKKAPARKAAAAKGAKKSPARKKAATPARKAVAAKKPAAKKAKAAAPARKPAAPPKKARAAAPVAKPRKKKSPARRAADAVKSAAKTVAAVVTAPVKAVASVVAGPVVETPPEIDEGSQEGASNGASILSAEDEEEESAGPSGESDPESLIERIESAYNVTLPERYRRFLRDGEYQRYPRIELAGYIRGPYDMDFVDELLPDVAELGQYAGIYDMDDVPWSDDYAGYVPLASLSHPEVDEPKVFLVHQVAGDQHRVLLFDYEGWRLYPLADSFDAFLANLPRATNDVATAFRPGT